MRLLLERIAEDPILRDAKLIAEAWDAAGAYQVGCFSQRRWAEWNGHFRDDVRRFWRGDEGMVGRFASRICGSSDLYAGSGKGPECSVNFVTCHDGFTLNDLVSYSRKHNEANGEDNRDGADENFSANYGVEGRSDDPAVEAVRQRQIKNFLLTLAISRGVPMLLGRGRVPAHPAGQQQRLLPGQRHELGRLVARPSDTSEIVRFTRGVLALSPGAPRPASGSVLHRARTSSGSIPDGTSPDWLDPRQKRLACLIRGQRAPTSI